MKPLVSIGIPVKNGFANRYLGNDFIYSENDIDLAKALDAIINQSFGLKMIKIISNREKKRRHRCSREPFRKTIINHTETEGEKKTKTRTTQKI